MGAGAVVPTRGALTARALTGAWRQTPPPSRLSPDELAFIAPHLLATGTAGLAWWAIRDNPELAQSAAGTLLRDAHRLHSLRAGHHALRLANVLDLCASVDVDPLLLKGWSVARLYPARGLRPYGDVDLAVRVDEHRRLQEALDARVPDPDWVDVDLEHRFLSTDGTPLKALNARATHVDLDGGRQVRVPRAEDQLRMVSLHYLRSGGWQPRALCDVALLLETQGAVDWELVLGDARHRQWITVAAGLASQLLRADLSGTPLDHATERVPGWVRSHVLKGFDTTASDHLKWQPRFRPTRHPADLVDQLRARWPADGLAVTMHHRRLIPLRTPFGNQCFDLAYRGVALAAPVRMRRARRDGLPEVSR